MLDTTSIPAALHRGADDLPWVDLGDGSFLQLLQVDIRQGLWVVRNRFLPGTEIVRHKHTGPVYAFTKSGSWKYAEYPEVNRAGSFLYEPAGSIHTLVVPADNTEDTLANFVIVGANLNLDDEDHVISVYDAGSVLRFYLKECAKLGIDRPDVIGIEQAA
ncbi:MAG: 2,4'-dihydroxyacetophenone dioxygenase family protein [Acidimicrobiales bacterium]|nr:2,4'-dihydroxyacetophenone dioxygenase family protein [Acidimicrobiales bacterium]